MSELSENARKAAEEAQAALNAAMSKGKSNGTNATKQLAVKQSKKSKLKATGKKRQPQGYKRQERRASR